MRSHVAHALLPDRPTTESADRVLRDIFWRDRKHGALASVTAIASVRANIASVPRR